MDNAANGTTTDVAKSFEWKPDDEAILQQIALTDVVDTEWTRLRDMIKYKIDKNVRQYLSGDSTGETNVTKPSDQVAQSSPVSLPPSSPSTSTTSPVNPMLQGLVIPPFPKRERRRDAPMRIFHSLMDEQEANTFKYQIFEQLAEFDNNPPFTIQRLCELCIEPKKYYKTVGKYLRALERTILVTSTSDMYPPEASEGDVEMTTINGDNESLRLAMAPVFSPIPFLHDDARRSRSPSPFELSGAKRSAGPHDDFPRLSMTTLPPRQALGLVDELDDPKPGHLADRPTALTAVTSPGSSHGTKSLNERFIKSTSPEVEVGIRDVSETVDSRQAEDAEVEGMVLDENVIEDEDKENRPS